MNHLTWILLCGTLCILHSQSYVLLTANVEDVQSIAHQVASSPLLNQIKDVWRRASRTFEKTLDSPKMRTDDQDEDDHAKDDNARNLDAQPDDKRDNDSASDDRKAPADNERDEHRAQRREAVEQLMNLGRNASVYLGSIKKIIDKI